MKKQHVVWLRSNSFFAVTSIFLSFLLTHSISWKWKWYVKLNFTKRILRLLCLLSAVPLFSCGGDDPPPEPLVPAPVEDSIAVTVNPAVLKQEMVGFGGALTWYSNWVTANNKVEEIANLMFEDLGIDIVRFKNWYYPNNYPSNKSTNDMPDDYAKDHWEATNKLYELAMERNPDVKILLSSWGPPRALKSNGQLQQGTLIKDGSGFMYDAFAEYWNDVLDHVPFNPDYISIQNEPTYINAGWTTCQWAANETSSLPGYDAAFNKVYDKIKTRNHVPAMIGPESQDVPTFVSFANVMKDNPNCTMYAFHPYNINSGTPASTITSSLQSAGAFTTKPNLMTEFSDNLNWYNTALFIHKALVEGNTSGYIYWKLAWSTPASGEDAGMISMNSFNATSGYRVTPYYYLIKHFSKHIDAGYHRVAVSSSSATLYNSAFISPDNGKLTIIVINDGSQPAKVYFEATGKKAGTIQVAQSKEGSYYNVVAVASPTRSVTLPAKSITTVALDF